MSDWILSKEITSAGFMSAPADLSQQLEAQREIAIREIHANRSRAGSANASDDESGNIAPSVGEMSPVSEEPSEEITDYPLFTSCFEALDLENRKGKDFRWPKMTSVEKLLREKTYLLRHLFRISILKELYKYFT